MWQMLSRKVPFKDVPMLAIPEYVNKGNRPTIPKSCPQKLALLIRSCWHAKPKFRPEFAEICRFLQVIAGLIPGALETTADYFRKCTVLPAGTPINLVTEMQTGSVMLKCAKHGKPHFSLFQLSSDAEMLQWTSRKKAPAETQLRIDHIRELLLGQQTPVFARCSLPQFESLSFSVITPERSLDIVCTTAAELRTWTRGLEALLPRGSRVRYSSYSLLSSASSTPTAPLSPVATPVPDPAPASAAPAEEARTAKTSENADTATIVVKASNSDAWVSKTVSFDLDGPTKVPDTPAWSNGTLSRQQQQQQQQQEKEKDKKEQEKGNKSRRVQLRRRSSSTSSLIGTGRSGLLPRPALYTMADDAGGVVRREENKDVYMWPIGRHESKGAPARPVLVPQLLGKDVCFVACGEMHYAALTFHGELYMWGSNKHGQLGQFLVSSTSGSAPATATTAAAAAADYNNSSDSDSDSNNSDSEEEEEEEEDKDDRDVAGELEREAAAAGDAGSAVQRVPQMVPFGGTRVHAVACGRSHTVCLTVDGRVFAWGRNQHGQLGLGDTAPHPTPTCVRGLAGVSLVACGDSTSAAYADSGALHMWGQNDTCQLGLGHNRAVLAPQPVPHRFTYTAAGPVAAGGITVRKELLSAGTPVASSSSLSFSASSKMTLVSTEKASSTTAAATTATTTATTATATATATATGASAPPGTPTKCQIASQRESLVDHVEVVALGQYHSAVLTTNGAVWQWGKLGDTIQATPVRVRLGRDGVRAMHLACGPAHAAAIGDDDVLYTWGAGHLGQLGRGAGEAFCAAPQPVPPAALGGPRRRPVQVACGASYTAVVADDGALCVWGLGARGRGVLADEAAPQCLRAFRAKCAAQVACGPRALVALVTQRRTPDARLRGWVPDHEAPACMACRAPFTALRRRHHCRKCEGVFCSACCHWKRPLLSKGFPDAVRVCFRCYSELGGDSAPASAPQSRRQPHR